MRECPCGCGNDSPCDEYMHRGERELYAKCPCGCGTGITGHDLRLCKLVDTFNAHQKLKEEADDVANELAQKVEEVVSLRQEVDALKLVISDIRKNQSNVDFSDDDKGTVAPTFRLAEESDDDKNIQE